MNNEVGIMDNSRMENLMEKVVNLAKRRGFVFPSSEIYEGLASTWDYGPLGVLLKNNVKQAWWKTIIQMRDDVVGLDAAILMNKKVWEASGHTQNFADLLVECKSCHKRFRKDHIGETCPNCGKKEFTEDRQFNLMFKTFMGPVEDETSSIFLRPETAQGIFVNFKNVLNTSRKKLPFGIAQIGKAFRNEITPGNFTFRTREFEQMELEWFCKPDEADSWYEYWANERYRWYEKLGINKDNLRKRNHGKDELAHYAKSATDIEYQFPFGWSELEGIANRTDFDLKQHQELSKKELMYFDNETKEKYLPYIIEPSAGADRATLAFLVDAYEEVIGNKTETAHERTEGEVVLHLHPSLAPIKVAILPLMKKEPLQNLAKEINSMLKEIWFCDYDETGSIGRRYRRQDEVGTPFCVTIDFESIENKTVTIRDRDSLVQERVTIKELDQVLKNKLNI